eukprot:TRINITY_DN902_c0_g1_i5.p1 TRINITY_DN902_c0_g1~~TRINITY_DN902_c0_g1_i5.p1  ORF type:complete len:312 (+),score=100.00 TRINITY_DN902_c0_g1_i5:76-936(+)
MDMAAFVPAASLKIHHAPASAPEARSANVGLSPQAADVLKPVGSAASWTAIAVAGAAGAIVGAARKQRKSKGVARNFFGGAAAPPPAPKVATSYKDYEDPWLGAADLGFDPFNLAVKGGTFDRAATAVPETTYYNYRESEVKHGRFAMAAFLAIFAEAADRSAVMRQLGSTSAVDNLDGTLGLDELQAPVLALGLGYQALAEYNLQRDETDGNILSVEYKKDRCPGDLGFDPLKLGNSIGSDKKGLHNVEVNMGRLGMIGVTAFLFKEFLVKDEAVLKTVLTDSAL